MSSTRVPACFRTFIFFCLKNLKLQFQQSKVVLNVKFVDLGLHCLNSAQVSNNKTECHTK